MLIASLDTPMPAIEVPMLSCLLACSVAAARPSAPVPLHRAGLVSLVAAAETELPAGSGALRHLVQAQLTARENLAEARSLVAASAPPQLLTGSLADALERLVERTGAEESLDVRFSVTGTPAVLPA